MSVLRYVNVYAVFVTISIALTTENQFVELFHSVALHNM